MVSKTQIRRSDRLCGGSCIEEEGNERVAYLHCPAMIAHFSAAGGFVLPQQAQHRGSALSSSVFLMITFTKLSESAGEESLTTDLMWSRVFARVASAIPS